MTTPAAHPEGARHELPLPDGSWWELGWDPPLGTFYAQLFANAHEPPVEWHGTSPGEHPDVDSLDAAVGRAIPAAIRAELEADRATYPAWDEAPEEEP